MKTIDSIQVDLDVNLNDDDFVSEVLRFRAAAEQDGSTRITIRAEKDTVTHKLPRMDFVNTLRRGDIVVAAADLDPQGANIKKGTLGVVFEETNAYGDQAGPMVRWSSGGCCNVYDIDVELA